MYALCVSGAVNTQGFAWIKKKEKKVLYINVHSFIHSRRSKTSKIAHTKTQY